MYIRVLDFNFLRGSVFQVRMCENYYMFCIRLKSHVQPTNLIPIQVKAFRIIDQHCANDSDKYWVCSTCFYQYITFIWTKIQFKKFPNFSMTHMKVLQQNWFVVLRKWFGGAPRVYDSGTAIGTLFRTHIRVIPASLVASQSTKHSFCSVQYGIKITKRRQTFPSQSLYSKKNREKHIVYLKAWCLRCIAS